MPKLVFHGTYTFECEIEVPTMEDAEDYIEDVCSEKAQHIEELAAEEFVKQFPEYDWSIYDVNFSHIKEE